MHAWLSSKNAYRRQQVASKKATLAAGSLAPSQRKIGFLLMTSAFAIQYLASASLLIHMVPFLATLGLGATAAIVGTLFGPSQVASRLINMVFWKRLDALHLAMISAALVALGALVLMFTAPSVAGAMVFAVVFGMGNGLLSVVSGTLPLRLFGSAGYGKLQGKIMAARLIVSASAPFAMAVAIKWSGPSMSLVIVVALGVVAMAFFVSLERLNLFFPNSGASR